MHAAKQVSLRTTKTEACALELELRDKRSHRNEKAATERSLCLPQLEKSQRIAVAPHSSPLAWKIPWTEEPGRLQPMGSCKTFTLLVMIQRQKMNRIKR